MKNKILFSVSLLSLCIIVFTFAKNDNLVGGDRDDHGCIGSAGYIWSSSTVKCIRPWENSSTTATNTGLNNAINHTNENSNVACVLFSKALRYGDSDRNNKGKEVRELQDKLREKGYLNASSTGYYGNATKNAVKKYQRDNNILATGNIFEKTLGQLKKHFCGNEENKTKEAPKDCKVWFDGCNTCFRSENGGQMACLTSKLVPSCKEYFTSTTSSIALIKACPTEKIINMMPVMCIKAPCPAVPKDSYYIYNGVRYEIDKFDADYVKNNCTVKDTKVY